jgi:hypothetical protein
MTPYSSLNGNFHKKSFVVTSVHRKLDSRKSGSMYFMKYKE